MTDPILSSSDAYRRQARRLRCRHAGHPHRLQLSLKHLATTSDVRPRPAVPASSPLTSIDRAGRARSYADYIADAMSASASASILRYSQRLELLRVAPRFGLNRFEANLAIAAVMSRRRSAVTEIEEADEPRDRSITTAVATFVLVQGAVALSVWWTLFR